MNKSPRILAIETSGRVGSVCVASGSAVLGREELPHDTRHASGLHDAIARLCHAQAWVPDSIDQVYVSGGPGSFTGVRIGITVARTLAWTTGAKIVRVPTMDALARNALQADDAPRFLVTVLDAKRSQIFGALFERCTEGTATGYRKRIDAMMIEPAIFLTQAAALAGNATPVAAVGEGLAQHCGAIEKSGGVILPESLWAARAESVHAAGWLMAARSQFCVASECEPIYVRLPEPEEKWLKQHGKSDGTSNPQHDVLKERSHEAGAG